LEVAAALHPEHCGEAPDRRQVVGRDAVEENGRDRRLRRHAGCVEPDRQAELGDADAARHKTHSLDAAQQTVYEQAMKMAEEHGPCCCRCWRYVAFRGQAKELIARRRYTAAQIAHVWDLEDGCGSGPMMMQ
jgi:hypothetical protein